MPDNVIPDVFPRLPQQPTPITLHDLGGRPLAHANNSAYAGWAIGAGLIAISHAIVRAAEILNQDKETLR